MLYSRLYYSRSFGVISHDCLPFFCLKPSSFFVERPLACCILGGCRKCTEHRTKNTTASCGPCPVSHSRNTCLFHSDILGVCFLLFFKITCSLRIKKSVKHKSVSPSGTPKEKQRQSFGTEENLDVINLPALRLENRKLRNIAQNTCIILSSI